MLKLIFPIKSLIKLIHQNKDKDLEYKVNKAIRQIEIQYRELEGLRRKIEIRRLALFKATVKAIEQRDCAKASICVNEYVELKKVIKAISHSMMALTFVSLKLESMRDIKDVMYHVSSAFKLIKGLNKIIPNLTIILESFTEEINSTLTEITTCCAIPNIIIDNDFEDCEKILAQARSYVKERFLTKEPIQQSESYLSQINECISYYNGKQIDNSFKLNLSPNEAILRNISQTESELSEILCEGIA
ncbi:MAG: hypothetical protein QW779_05470 [Nitrososphaerales archaeon]